MTEKKRNLNLDLARCTALLMVPIMHSFDHTGMYDQQLYGTANHVMLVLKLLFTSCIPLYVMLSGFLCSRKQLSARYYLGLVRILVIYFICSVVTMAVEQFTGLVHRSFSEMVSALLNCTCSSYTWYILMYFGLFLLIPFLNMAYNGLKTQREKQVLVLTFIAMSVLPSLLNTYFQIMSMWWARLYPLCYYFTGAYLREYLPQIRLRKLLACLVAFVGLYAVFFYFRYDASGAAMTGIYQDTWEVYIISVLIFVIILRLPLDKLPKVFSSIISKVSELTLPTYLLTWIPDSLIYPVLMANVATGPARYKWLFITVPISLVSALIMAQLVQWLYGPVDKLVKKLGQKPFFTDSDPLGVPHE
jgi:surface polysaccharide O-acyltransferase-like enzyme